MEEEIVDEVTSILELADIAKSLQLPPATGEKGKGPRTRLREAMEQAAKKDDGSSLDLRGVNPQEIHDSDVAHLARIAYVSSYLRIIDLMMQPADSFAKRLAVAKVAQANINNAEATKLSVLQLGRNSATDVKLQEQIKKMRETNRALAERHLKILYDHEKNQEADRKAEEATLDESPT